MISEEKIKNAKETLSIESTDIDERTVFDNFLDKLISAKSEHEKSEAVKAKIALMIYLDEERHKRETAFFVPIKNYCKKCASKGYIPEREIVLEKIGCPDCDGTGLKTVPCKKCNGEGYINGSVCSICKGSGKYRLYKTKNRDRNFHCGRCQGSGEVYEVHLGSNILDFEICPKCKGVGFNPHFPAVKVPQIKDLGGMITQKMEKISMPTFGQMKDAFEKASQEKGEAQEGKE